MNFIFIVNKYGTKKSTCITLFFSFFLQVIVYLARKKWLLSVASYEDRGYDANHTS